MENFNLKKYIIESRSPLKEEYNEREQKYIDFVDQNVNRIADEVKAENSLYQILDPSVTLDGEEMLEIVREFRYGDTELIEDEDEIYDKLQEEFARSLITRPSSQYINLLKEKYNITIDLTNQQILADNKPISWQDFLEYHINPKTTIMEDFDTWFDWEEIFWDFI